MKLTRLLAEPYDDWILLINLTLFPSITFLVCGMTMNSLSFAFQGGRDQGDRISDPRNQREDRRHERYEVRVCQEIGRSQAHTHRRKPRRSRWKVR